MSWQSIGSATVAMGRAVLAGLAVSSHVSSATSQAVFDNVSVR
jgi:hypothetical protein